MLLVPLQEAADDGTLIIVDGGICRFLVRRDGVVVIRELFVLPRSREKGVGRRIVQQIRDEYPRARLMALCPVKYESNGFWRKIGFRFMGYKVSGKRRVNVWVHYP